MAEGRLQTWPRPRHPRPIVIIGAGGIVRHAHLPAYRRAGLEVVGLHDLDQATARRTARRFGVPRVFATLEEAALADAVFDLAVPADQILAVLSHLPRRATVLIQKPMGRNLKEARRILALCRRRQLKAAVNFQLRFSPNMLLLRQALRRGQLGELTDLEVRVNTHTPWEQWAFLRGIPRLEMLYHSIHYLDLIRSLLGDPAAVKCWAGPHPLLPGYADTRSAIILDYGSGPRCLLSLNHQHVQGSRHAASELKLEGTRGAALARMGVNLDYPRGRRDTLELAGRRGTWRPVRLVGSWFVHAFAGTMCNLQRHAAGEDPQLLSSVEDAFRTMALVEACYRAAARRGTHIPC